MNNELGYYFPTSDGTENGVVLIKMGTPKKPENLPLDHSGSNFVSFKDINPQFEEN